MSPSTSKLACTRSMQTKLLRRIACSRATPTPRFGCGESGAGTPATLVHDSVVLHDCRGRECVSRSCHYCGGSRPQHAAARARSCDRHRFDGSLTLPPSVIATLGLPWRRRGRVLLADGSERVCDIFEATLIWDSVPRRIPVDAAETVPLIGMSLLYGHELTIQVVDGGEVTITTL